jgi:FkbM family methyltransferase
MAHAHLPRARIHLIEPQPECAKTLLGLCGRFGFSFHPFALVAPERSGKNIGFLVTPGAVTTGARVDNGSGAGDVERVEVEARSLDEILAADLGREERLFLKLDLEGHELEALKGARRVLQATEVVLEESCFFGDPPPTNSPLQLATFLAEHGFSLYDVTSISGRPRDKRARQCDLLFVKDSSPISVDRRWF